MNLCSENHDEVCFEGSKCPACKLWEETNELSDKLTDAQKVIDQQENEIGELNDQIKELKSQ